MIQHSMRSYWTENEGDSFQKLARHALSLTTFQAEKFSLEKLKLEHSCQHDGKGVLNVKFAWSSEQGLAASSDSELSS